MNSADRTRIKQHARKLANDWPPLTEEQKTKVQNLLLSRGLARAGGDDH